MMAYWPAETLAGILDSQPMGFYSPRVLLNEARRKGVEVRREDLHLSGKGFRVEKDGRGLSERAISAILSEREGRPFART